MSLRGTISLVWSWSVVFAINCSNHRKRRHQRLFKTVFVFQLSQLWLSLVNDLGRSPRVYEAGRFISSHYSSPDSGWSRDRVSPSSSHGIIHISREKNRPLYAFPSEWILRKRTHWRECAFYATLVMLTSWYSRKRKSWKSTLVGPFGYPTVSIKSGTIGDGRKCEKCYSRRI